MTNLFDLIDCADYDAAVAAKLITVRDDGAGLRILNYSDAALYTPGAWDNPAVRQCRGIIVDDDWTIHARPWAKFFNHGQVEAEQYGGHLDLDAPVEVTDKLDGSLGIIYRDLAGEVRVATRGSFQSEQAVHATKWLWGCGWSAILDLDGVTPLVEVLYPGNRIVCDYGDRDELVLLGAVDNGSGHYYGPEMAGRLVGWWGGQVEVTAHATLREALEAPPRPGAEGLCVRYLDRPQIVKIKQDDYVRLHRIVTGLSERTVWQHMVDGKPLEDLLAPLPDELHQWTRDVWDGLVMDVDETSECAGVAHGEILQQLGPDCSRRDYAEQAKQHGDLTPYLFNLLDGRDPRPRILAKLKPAGDTRAKAISEAVA